MKHLILGNGPAGVLAAETLRGADPWLEILLAGSEDAPPYSRMAIPYLLEGQIDESGTYLRKEPGHYARLGIEERRGRAVALDTDRPQRPLPRRQPRDLRPAPGRHRLPPDAPADPRHRPAPGPAPAGPWRTPAPSLGYARQGSRVVQLGAGFIGCIIMESLAARGVELTVVELGDRMVPRMMTQKAGNMIRRWVESKGIRVITQAGHRPHPARRTAGSAPWRST